MRFKEFLQERASEARKTRRQAERNEHAKQQAEKMAKMYDGKPMKITRPVVMANGKTENREFTIDNLLPVRRALSGVTLRDMSQVEVNPDKRGSKPSYVIDVGTGTKGASIPHRVHGLPVNTKRKAGYSHEDLRREAYV